jgi:hypothetical protein
VFIMANQRVTGGKGFVLCMLMVVVAYIGMVGYIVIASSFTEAFIAGRLAEPFDTSVFGQLEPKIIKSDMFIHSKSKSSAVHSQIYIQKSDGLFYSTFGSTLKEASIGAVYQELVFQWEDPFQPFFVIPLAIHFCIVIPFRFILKSRFLKRRLNRRALSHVLLSLVGLVAIVWCVQFAHITWASHRWGVGAYLNDARVDGFGLMFMYAIAVVAYGYILVVTALPRHQADGVLRCAGCGYEGIGDAQQCFECGLCVGEVGRDKRGKCSLILGGLLLFLFFTPVLVSSVYRVLG